MNRNHKKQKGEDKPALVHFQNPEGPEFRDEEKGEESRLTTWLGPDHRGS